MDVSGLTGWTVELVGPGGYSHGWVKAGAPSVPLRGSGARRPTTRTKHFEAGDVIMSKGTGASETHIARVTHVEPHPNGMGAPTYTVQHLHHKDSSKVGKTEKIAAGRIDSGSHRKVTRRGLSAVVKNHIYNANTSTAGPVPAQTELISALHGALGQ